ncbi:hypothetical protein LAUMK191_02566 [Mycobacterium attenuatum]|nr:hypothetical protein LAUMK191_02566 [Mycobacterium attenuatum]
MWTASLFAFGSGARSRAGRFPRGAIPLLLLRQAPNRRFRPACHTATSRPRAQRKRPYESVASAIQLYCRSKVMPGQPHAQEPVEIWPLPSGERIVTEDWTAGRSLVTCAHQPRGGLVLSFHDGPKHRRLSKFGLGPSASSGLGRNRSMVTVAMRRPPRSDTAWAESATVRFDERLDDRSGKNVTPADPPNRVARSTPAFYGQQLHLDPVRRREPAPNHSEGGHRIGAAVRDRQRSEQPRRGYRASRRS